MALRGRLIIVKNKRGCVRHAPSRLTLCRGSGPWLGKVKGGKAEMRFCLGRSCTVRPLIGAWRLIGGGSGGMLLRSADADVVFLHQRLEIGALHAALFFPPSHLPHF